MFELKDLQEYTALPPVVFDAPKTLILMSMPSVDSEEARFYFADESNRFWPLLSAIYQMPAETPQERLKLMEANHLALWSVVKSCSAVTLCFLVPAAGWTCRVAAWPRCRRAFPCWRLCPWLMT